MGAFRLLLALAVVVTHASPPFGIEAFRMTGGSLAVQIFYVISGFYMAMILNHKYVGQGAFVAFVKNRFLRLYPMFLVVLLVTLMLGVAIDLVTGRAIEPLAFWLEQRGHMSLAGKLLFGISNVTIVGEDLVSFTAIDPVTGQLYLTTDFHREAVAGWHFLFVPQAWTVGVELMFYVVAPLLVRRRPLVVASVMAASLALRMYIMGHWHLVNDPWTYRFFPTELALFLAGALSYRLYERRQAWLDRRRGLARGVTAGAIAVVLLYALLPASLQTAPYGLPLVLATIPFVIPFMFSATGASHADRALGELSYPVYIVHYPLVFVLHALDVPWVEAQVGAIALVLSVVTAWVLYRVVGAPIERTRSRIGRELASPSS